MEKPLYVQVAEALGCNSPKYYIDADQWHCRCGCYEHAIDGEKSETSEIQRYDTDWSATGPLIEKYWIRLAPHQGMDVHGDGGWNASQGTWANFRIGVTPLIAVCNLILALAKAGKLKAA